MENLPSGDPSLIGAARRHDRQSRHALATPRLAHQPERASGRDRKTDSVDRADVTCRGRHAHPQRAQFEQDRVVCLRAASHMWLPLQSGPSGVARVECVAQVDRRGS